MSRSSVRDSSLGRAYRACAPTLVEVVGRPFGVFFDAGADLYGKLLRSLGDGVTRIAQAVSLPLAEGNGHPQESSQCGDAFLQRLLSFCRKEVDFRHGPPPNGHRHQSRSEKRGAHQTSRDPEWDLEAEAHDAAKNDELDTEDSHEGAPSNEPGQPHHRLELRHDIVAEQQQVLPDQRGRFGSLSTEELTHAGL